MAEETQPEIALPDFPVGFLMWFRIGGDRVMVRRWNGVSWEDEPGIEFNPDGYMKWPWDV